MRLWTGAVVLLLGCSSFGPVPPELLVALARETARAPRTWRGRARIEILSPRVAGEFEAVLAATTDPEPRARLQLWPDLGGKLLDVVARPDRIQGRFASADVHVDADPSEAPRELLVFMGITLLEQVAPLGRERVRGVRRVGDLWVADVVPIAGDYDLRVRVDARGHVLERRFRFRHVTWTEVEGRTIQAPSFKLIIKSASVEPTAELPAGIFELP